MAPARVEVVAEEKWKIAIIGALRSYSSEGLEVKWLLELMRVVFIVVVSSRLVGSGWVGQVVGIGESTFSTLFVRNS